MHKPGYIPSESSGSVPPLDLCSAVFQLETLLQQIAQNYHKPALASSLSAEDMVITDVVMRLELPIDIFTLDTGRLHAETLALLPRIEAKYGRGLMVYYPNADQVHQYVTQYGLNAFYDSVDLRHRCCGIRKVEPSVRALAGRSAWLTGQRKEQSLTRTSLMLMEHDADRNMAKFNPLVDWTQAWLWNYIEQFDVPVNPLHARGYPSIGCEPCTRAIKPGEDPRAGRWWWEQQDSRECGLHVASAKATLDPLAIDHGVAEGSSDIS